MREREDRSQLLSFRQILRRDRPTTPEAQRSLFIRLANATILLRIRHGWTLTVRRIASCVAQLVPDRSFTFLSDHQSLPNVARLIRWSLIEQMRANGILGSPL